MKNTCCIKSDIHDGAHTLSFMQVAIGILKRTTIQNMTLQINLPRITAQMSLQGIKNLKAIKHWMSVEGKDVDLLIDMGASVNVLPSKYATQQLEPYEGKLLMWNNSETQPKGHRRLKLINPKTLKKYSVPFLVIQGNNVPILGLGTSMQMGLVTVNNDCDFVSNLQIDDFADAFDGGLGELPGTQHLQLKPDAIPVVMANRRTPLAVRPRLKTELEQLVNLGDLMDLKMNQMNQMNQLPG